MAIVTSVTIVTIVIETTSVRSGALGIRLITRAISGDAGNTDAAKPRFSSGVLERERGNCCVYVSRVCGVCVCMCHVCVYVH